MKKLFQKIQQESTIFLFAKMWRFAQGRRRYVILFVVLSVIANLILLSVPWIVGQFLNEIQVNGFGEHNLVWLIVILGSLIVVEIVFWVFHGTSRIIERICAFWTSYNYTKYLMGGVLDLNISWHNTNESGNVIDKVNNARNSLQDFSDNIFQIIGIIVKIVGTLIVLLFFDASMAVILLVLLIATLVLVYQFDRKLIPQYDKLNIFGNKISARIFDTLSNVTTVKIIHIENSVLKSIKESLKVPFVVFKQNTYLNEFKWATSTILFRILVVLPMAFYMFGVYAGGGVLEVGTISALYLYLSNLTGAFFGFAYFYEQLIVKKTKILNAKSIEEKFAMRSTNRRLIGDYNKFNISGIKFTYPNETSGKVHLQIDNFQMKKGERVALIGASGSGKTTFLKILHGLYQDIWANVKIDNQKSARLNLSDIDLATMLVPQEPEIFATTIRDNITMGLDYSDQQIAQAMRLAKFDDVAEELPQKWNSVINEKGVNLSGGQKQRLALSRALLFAKDKQIILLDEPTSSVDAQNETEIYQNIFAQFADKTIIASVHKLNLLKFFDRIIIFDSGKIVDSGTFAELLVQNKSFRMQWEEFLTTKQKEM